jgi:hypothetical protein
MHRGFRIAMRMTAFGATSPFTRSGEGRLFTRPGSSPLPREGPVWDQDDLLLERG